MKLKNFRNIALTFKIYLLALLIFTLFRVLFLISETDKVDDSVVWPDLIHAFVMGLRFDTVICCYILVLPYLVFSSRLFTGLATRWANAIIFTYLLLLFSLSFMVCSADIPYFSYFFSRFSMDAFQWMDTPRMVLGMIMDEPRLYLYIIPFLLSLVIFSQLLAKLILDESPQQRTGQPLVSAAISLLFFGIMFLGIRGRVEEDSPIRVGTAYFSKSPFVNQLGLNPNFTLIRSFIDSRKEINRHIRLIDDKEAIGNVRNYLHITTPDKDFPLMRKENGGVADQSKHNVVLVLMESMLASNLERNGNTEHLTPVLDSLSRQGCYFENAYSAGVHTCNGLFSTLCSFPAIFTQNPLNESSMFHYHGLSATLKKLGYSTIYFMTHDGQFDNNEGFLRVNDFDQVISQKDYPSREIKTDMGVPDDFMFRFAMPYLNRLGSEKKPFLSVFLTTSNHPSYYTPPYFQGHQPTLRKQVIEYADFSIGTFMKMASRQPWFDNTLFVFVADHGLPRKSLYDISLDTNHIPLIFYSPHLLGPSRVCNKMAGQIDVFPSIMGILNLPYDNTTLGINLFREERPYIFFNGENKYGVIDNEWFLVVRQDGFEGLYKYRLGERKNFRDEEAETAARMKKYAVSNLQSFQFVLEHRLM